MRIDSDKRAASLAVARYGADQTLVRGAYRAARQATAGGDPADLVSILVSRKLLTSSQAEEIRRELDRTRLDPKDEKAKLVESPAPAPGGEDSSSGSGLTPRSLGGYRVLRRIGEGGMGAVYLGYHEAQRSNVAIKVLADGLANTPAYLNRFLREARSGAVLAHPNLVRFIGAGQDQATGKHYLVLEYVDGPSARSLLDRYGRLDVGDAVHVILDIARALEHLHSRSFVHRDIKPDNILIMESGLAKLADLGLAKCLDDATHLTGTRQSIGTPYYMPYEQVISAKKVDGRSDIYALGATLYHLLTGEVPFPGDTALEVTERKVEGVFRPASDRNPAVPASLDRILDRMLARHPRDRYQTASELIIDLERAKLAASVPSFVNPEVAYRDPLVRARLSAPVQSTHMDMRPPPVAPAANGSQVWYLRYRGREGRWCKTTASTEQLLQQLRSGQAPAELEVCRVAQGLYRSPRLYPELRPALAGDAKDAGVGPSAAFGPPSRTSSRWRLWGANVLVAAGIFLGFAVSAGVGIYLFVIH